VAQKQGENLSLFLPSISVSSGKWIKLKQREIK
jgi:hypothetical protein